MTPVAIIFDNFGPYHLARLRAASAVCHLLAIEVAGKSAVYAWENEPAGRDFQRITLIENGTSDDVSRVELVRRLENALDDFQPAVVVVPGWASPAAWGAMRWCLAHGVPMVCLSESTAWDETRVAWKEAIKRRLVGMFGSALVGGHHHRDYLVALGLPPDDERLVRKRPLLLPSMWLVNLTLGTHSPSISDCFRLQDGVLRHSRLRSTLTAQEPWPNQTSSGNCPASCSQ